MDWTRRPALPSGFPQELVAAAGDDADAAGDGAVGEGGNEAAAGAAVEGECCVLGNTKGAPKAEKSSAVGSIFASEKWNA